MRRGGLVWFSAIAGTTALVSSVVLTSQSGYFFGDGSLSTRSSDAVVIDARPAIQKLVNVTIPIVTTTTVPPAPPTVPGPPGLVEAITARLSDPRFEGATVGLSVWMDGIGDIVAHNADTLLRPASNQKLLTTMGAFSVLGPDARLATEVRAAGPVDGGVLNGDLVLVGGGDPTVRSGGHAHSLDGLAAQVRASGITVVNGDVVGDETRYDAQRVASGWSDFHMPRFVGSLSALAVDWNQVRVDPEYTSNPALVHVQMFRASLARHGVQVGGGERLTQSPPSLPVVAALYSSPVSELTADMLTRSDNFYAEMLLKEVGYKGLGKGTTVDGIAAATNAIQGLGLKLRGESTDGCGLSRLDRRSAREWRDMLGVARAQPWGGAFLEGLPLAGRTGTLASRLRGTPAEATLRAKTGSVRDTRSLSGYLTATNGRQAVFSLVVNSSPLPPNVLGAMDDLVAAIAGTPTT